MEQLFKKWKRQRMIEQALISLGLSLPLCSLVVLFLHIPLDLYPLILLFISISVLFISLWKTGYFSTKMADLAHFLNQKYPELEHSSDLLLQKKGTLSGIAILQKEKIGHQLNQLNVNFPNRLPQTLLILFTGCLLSWGIHHLPLNTKNKHPLTFKQYDLSKNLNYEDSMFITSAPKLLKANIKVESPSYTNLKSSSTKELDIEVPFWSIITWNLAFDRALTNAELIFGDGKTLPLQENEQGWYSNNLQIKKSTFYQVKYRSSQSEWQLSDYHQIEVIEDQAPEITVEGLPAYAEYVFNPDKTLSFSVTLSDDYGLENAWMIATLSKGEGESVKFRDDTLYFEESLAAHHKQYKLNKTIRLGDLNMESGDELYLHIEAMDQRLPSPQTSKTYKYILAFENPDRMEVDMTGGLAVNRMPEYFRSQRQIIIDTEKLIAERSKLKPILFNEKSNNIAIDQKLLRLRYGRFLGEEFETVIGAGHATAKEDHDHEEHSHEDHDHEEDHEHQQSEDQYLAEDHEHEENWGGPSEDEEIKELEPFVHAHDVTEEVTYFDATTTAKLRVALAEMWNAELHLRMGNPEKALPFEYQALKIIKEIQHASRIYVERIGFDPPVIKVAENRLTGELKKVQNSSVQLQSLKSNDYPAMRKALPLLEALKERTTKLNNNQKKQLQAAGDELASLALEQPGGFLIGLQKLRSIMEAEVDPKTRIAYLEDLQKLFWDILPDDSQPIQQAGNRSELREIFLRELE